MSLFFSVGVLAVGGVLGYGYVSRGVDRWRIGSRVASKDTDAVASIAPGFVEVEGTVESVEGQTEESPFTDEEVVCADREIEEVVRKTSRVNVGTTRRRRGTGRSRRRGRRRRNRTKREWKTVHSEEVRNPFLVDDGSGKVLVEPEDATLILDRAREPTVTTSSFGGLPDELREYEESCGVTPADAGGISLFGRQITKQKRRYRRDVLKEGDTVYVQGEARRTEERDAPARHVIGDTDEEDAGYVGDEATSEQSGFLGAVSFGGNTDAGDAGTNTDLLISDIEGSRLARRRYTGGALVAVGLFVFAVSSLGLLAEFGVAPLTGASLWTSLSAVVFGAVLGVFLVLLRRLWLSARMRYHGWTGG